jgi:hypothetical protein
MKIDTYTKLVLTVIAVCLLWLSVRNMDFTSTAHAEAVPQNTEVTKYALAWNKDQNVGLVRLSFPNGQKYDAKITSAADLAGWAALLNQKPVYVDRNGWIFTGTEVPGQ